MKITISKRKLKHAMYLRPQNVFQLHENDLFISIANQQEKYIGKSLWIQIKK